MEMDNGEHRTNLAALREATATLAGLRRTLGDSSRGKCILWVDDQPDNNDLPRRLLEQEGAAIKLALSTDDARTVLTERASAVDLVISDMSRGDRPLAGLEMIEYVRDLNRGIPVLIYSDSPLAEERRKQIQVLGGIGPLVGPQSLLDMIASTLTVKKPNNALERD